MKKLDNNLMQIWIFSETCSLELEWASISDFIQIPFKDDSFNQRLKANIWLIIHHFWKE